MANHKITGWGVSKGLARGILRDRVQRRRILGQLLMLALAMMAAGLWLFDRWLMADLWRFFLWWAACAVITSAVMLFALYDLLAVLREERGKPRVNVDKR